MTGERSSAATELASSNVTEEWTNLIHPRGIMAEQLDTQSAYWSDRAPERRLKLMLRASADSGCFKGFRRGLNYLTLRSSTDLIADGVLVSPPTSDQTLRAGRP